jgi:hypothetical protein
MHEQARGNGDIGAEVARLFPQDPIGLGKFPEVCRALLVLLGPNKLDSTFVRVRQPSRFRVSRLGS